MTKANTITSNWLEPITDEMNLVKDKLSTEITTAPDIIKDMLRHVIGAGGKRLRPAITLLSAMAANPKCDLDLLTNIACATELVHTASLVHDDVIDMAQTRRGVLTTNVIWSDRASILLGDYLLARVFLIFVASDKRDIAKMLTNMSANMITSEIVQSTKSGDIEYWRKNYKEVIYDKTAAFMGVCARAGAVVAEADDDVQNALAEYGRNLGEAFQIVDDILDITGDPQAMGKPIGIDIMCGKYTLPVLMAIDMTGDKTGFINLLKADEKDIDRIKEIIEDSGAIDAAYKEANDCAKKACSALSILPKSVYLTSLYGLADFIVSRKN